MPEEPVLNNEEENLTFKTTNNREQIITIENDLVILELTTKGARIKKYYLKNYQTWYYKKLPEDAPFYQKDVQLINYSQDGGDLNILFVTKEGKFINTDKLDFVSNAQYYNYSLTGDEQLNLTFTYTTEDGNSIQKIFNFYGNKYISDVDIILHNMQNIKQLNIRSKIFNC